MTRCRWLWLVIASLTLAPPSAVAFRVKRNKGAEEENATAYVIAQIRKLRGDDHTMQNVLSLPHARDSQIMPDDTKASLMQLAGQHARSSLRSASGGAVMIVAIIVVAALIAAAIWWRELRNLFEKPPSWFEISEAACACCGRHRQDAGASTASQGGVDASECKAEESSTARHSEASQAEKDEANRRQKHRRRSEEEDARKKQEEEESRKQQAEELADEREKDEAEVAEGRKRQEEELRKRQESEAAEARKRQQEEDARRLQEEEEARRKEEKDEAEAAEARKRQEEEALRKWQEEEAAEALKQEEEERRKRQEAADVRKRQEEEELRKRQEVDAAEALKRREEQETSKRQEEEARKKEAAELRKRQEEEAERKRQEDEQAAACKAREKQEGAERKRQQDEQVRKRKQEEQAQAKKKLEEDRARALKKAEAATEQKEESKFPDVPDATAEFGGSVTAAIKHFSAHTDDVREVKVFSSGQGKWYKNVLSRPHWFTEEGAPIPKNIPRRSQMPRGTQKQPQSELETKLAAVQVQRAWRDKQEALKSKSIKSPTAAESAPKAPPTNAPPPKVQLDAAKSSSSSSGERKNSVEVPPADAPLRGPLESYDASAGGAMGPMGSFDDDSAPVDDDFLQRNSSGVLDDGGYAPGQKQADVKANQGFFKSRGWFSKKGGFQ